MFRATASPVLPPNEVGVLVLAGVVGVVAGLLLTGGVVELLLFEFVVVVMVELPLVVGRVVPEVDVEVVGGAVAGPIEKVPLVANTSFMFPMFTAWRV